MLQDLKYIALSAIGFVIAHYVCLAIDRTREGRR